MIKIGKPRKYEKENIVYLSSYIEDEYQKIKEEIHYSVPIEYGDFFTEDVADAFLVGMLLPAVRYNEDIYVDAAISEKLYYNITNSVLYTLSLVWNNRIKLHVKETLVPKYDSFAVGCGCSLGVDSFAAMLQHINGNKNTPSYEITHLTYFNVGAMGYTNLDKAKESYERDLQRVMEYAKKINKPVICLESNFSIMFKEFDFDQSGDIRNFSAALSLQKLFKKYLYGSSYPIKDFRFEQSQTGYYETLLAPILSTENCEFIIANPDMSRIEKTKYILDNEDVRKNLYVCWKEIIVNKNPNSEIAKIKDNYLNCSRCDKCLRTLLAIDIFGKLDKYTSIFDIEYYKQVKEKYIAKVIYQRKGNAFYEDLFHLMKDKKYKIPTKSIILVFLYKTKLMSIYSRLKRILKK